MFLIIALSIGIGLELPLQGPAAKDDPCQPAKEEQYLEALRDEQLKLDEPELFIHAIQCLGDIKSLAAVNPLIDLLSYRRSFWWDGTGAIPRIVLPTGRYPAGGALARIGTPALPSVIRAVTEFENASVEYEVLFYVLLTVFHYEREEGLSFIRKAGIAAKSEQARGRLEELASHYASHYKFEEEH